MCFRCSSLDPFTLARRSTSSFPSLLSLSSRRIRAVPRPRHWTSRDLASPAMAAAMDHDYYDGFRTFSWLANFIGLPIDQVRRTRATYDTGKHPTGHACRCPPAEIPRAATGDIDRRGISLSRPLFRALSRSFLHSPMHSRASCDPIDAIDFRFTRCSPCSSLLPKLVTNCRPTIRPINGIANRLFAHLDLPPLVAYSSVTLCFPDQSPSSCISYMDITPHTVISTPIYADKTTRSRTWVYYLS